MSKWCRRRPARCAKRRAAFWSTHDGEQIRSIRGDEDDPFSRGYVCPKAAALADLHDDPDRVRAPLIREGSRWREASWEDALDRAADGLVRVRKAARA